MKLFPGILTALMLAVASVSGCSLFDIDDEGDEGGSSSAQSGLLPGKFTVDDQGHQIGFSQGLLLYFWRGDNKGKWMFAEHQWDVSATDAIAHYCWGCSGYPHGANVTDPDSYSDGHPEDFYAYGDPKAKLSDNTGKADWGYNAILNGGNKEGLWRTPESSELGYIMSKRTTESGLRYVLAKIDGKRGVIFLPDNWKESAYSFNNPNSKEYGTYDKNVISTSDWTKTLEPAGCVFIVAAGQLKSWVEDFPRPVARSGEEGHYWLNVALPSDATECSSYFFGPNDVSTGYQVRWAGYSVRLVRDVK